MKTLFLATTAMLMLIPGLAQAQTEAQPQAQNAESSFTGVKIGAEISRVRETLRADSGNVGATAKSTRNGIGYRGYLGYDYQIGPVVIGAEAGIGGGGRSIRQSGARGSYVLDPGLRYDVSARAGLVPVDGLLIYGRGGYRWLKSERRTTSTGASALPATTKQTERAVTYGVGAELLVDKHFSLRAEYDRTPYDRNLRANAFSMGAAFRF